MKTYEMLDLTDQATDVGSEWFSSVQSGRNYVRYDSIWIDADITAITGGTLDVIVQVLTPKAVADGSRPSTTTGTDLPNMRLWDANLATISSPDQVSWISSKYVDPAANSQAMDVAQPGPTPPWFRVYMNTAGATWSGNVYVMLW